MFRTIRRLQKLSFFELRILAHAFFLLAFIRLSLWLLPFRVVHRFFGQSRYKNVVLTLETELVDKMVWAITVAGGYLPKITCLVEAYALYQMMISRGFDPKLLIGVARNPERGFVAHAWVEHQNLVLIGDMPSLDTYLPLPTIHTFNSSR